MTRGLSAEYGSAVALKVRVMASHGPISKDAVPTLVYRAEAYEETDRFREPQWGCSHNHDSVEDAFNCGLSWLHAQSDDSAAETA
jgi:hypothetical protein